MISSLQPLALGHGLLPGDIILGVSHINDTSSGSSSSSISVTFQADYDSVNTATKDDESSSTELLPQNGPGLNAVDDIRTILLQAQYNSEYDLNNIPMNLRMENYTLTYDNGYGVEPLNRANLQTLLNTVRPLRLFLQSPRISILVKISKSEGIFLFSFKFPLKVIFLFLNSFWLFLEICKIFFNDY